LTSIGCWPIRSRPPHVAFRPSWADPARDATGTSSFSAAPLTNARRCSTGVMR
jgi:hypothetical protein